MGNREVFVLCCNDFPIGVFSSHELADSESDTHKTQMMFLNSWDAVQVNTRLHYHIHRFEINEGSNGQQRY